MKTTVKILNAVGAVIASLLMPVLLCVLIVCPLAGTVVSLTEPETVADLISEVDVSSIASANSAVDSAIEKLGVPPSAIDDLLELDIVEDFARMYMEDAEAQLLEGQDGSAITEKKLLGLLDGNMDELVGFIREYAPDQVGEMTDDEIRTLIRTTAEKEAAGVIEALPPVSDIVEEISYSGIPVSIISQTYDFIKSSLMPIMYAMIVLLSLLIFACRAYHLEGTIWLGIDYLLSAAALLIISAAGRGILAALEFTGLSGVLLSVLGGALTPYTVSYLIIGALLVGAFVVIRILISKKRRKDPAVHNRQTAEAYARPAAANANPYSAVTPQYSSANANPYSAQSVPQYRPAQYQPPQYAPAPAEQPAPAPEAARNIPPDPPFKSS